MQIVVSAYAGWHGIQLAEQLHQRKALEKFASVVRPRKLRLDPSEIAYPTPIALADVMRRRIERHLNISLPKAVIQSTITAYDRWSCSLLSERTDLVTCWGPFSSKLLATARQRGIPCVLDVGSTHYETQERILKEEYSRAGLTYSSDDWSIARYREHMGLANYIALPSRFVRQSFLDAGFPEKKLIQVPYGVDAQLFRPASQPPEKFRVLFCGAISIRKGVRYLLQAYRELKLPESELLLVGDVEGDILPYLEKYSGPDVRVLSGTHPGQAMADVYRLGSVFVIPSVEEGLARVQLEAMASGLPVIGTPNTGAEDILTEGREGFVVPIRDVEALKEKISWLHANPEARRAMGQAARARVEAELTWDHYGERMFRAYQRIIDSCV